MKTIKHVLLIQILIVVFSSCSNKDGQLIDNAKLMSAYKDNYQSKPEILSIEIDTLVKKARITAYFDSVLVLEKEKQIVDNRKNAERLEKSLNSGNHWFLDRKINNQEKAQWPKWLEEHKQIIQSVMNGGDKLDSVNTIKKIVSFNNKARHDSIKFQLIFFTVEQKASESSAIKYDKWLSLETNESGPLEDTFFPLKEGTTEELTNNIVNSLIDFEPNKPYRKKGNGLFGF